MREESHSNFPVFELLSFLMIMFVGILLGLHATTESRKLEKTMLEINLSIAKSDMEATRLNAVLQEETSIINSEISGIIFEATMKDIQSSMSSVPDSLSIKTNR